MTKHLLRAIQEGSSSKVKKALRDHNVSSKDDNGRTPLHLAAEEGQLSIVRLLLTKRVQINKTI